MTRPQNMATELKKIGEGALAQIKAPQELVHIKHKITLLQYKYWILMLRTYRELYEDGEAFRPGEYCYLSMPAVAEALGYQPKTSEIERDLEALRVESLVRNVLEKDGQKAKEGTGFISQWKVMSTKIGVVFPDVLREAVENLDRKDSIFHLLNWNIFNSFTGKYEAVLYKLCKDFVGVKETPWIPLDKFREYMGVKPDEYADFKRLNQWVISGPVKRINASELSDIEVDWEPERKQRKVVALKFRVRPRRQTMLDLGDHPAFRFAKVKISLAQQNEYLAKAAAETIEYSILRANEYAEERERKGEPADLHKIYRKAIELGWGDEYRAKLLAAEAKKAKEGERKRAAAEKAAAETERKKASEALRAKGEEALASLGPEALEALFARWKDEERPAPVMSKNGAASPAFRVWARKALAEAADGGGERPKAARTA